MFNNSEIQTVKNCTVFKNLNKEELSTALQTLSAVTADYKKGQIINLMGEKLPFFGLVLNGTVQIYSDDSDGNSMMMATASKGNTFGESLCYLGVISKVYAVAATDCKILKMNTNFIKQSSSLTGLQKQLANSFTAMLAKRALSMNDRIQILSKHTLQEKLMTLFCQYSKGINISFTVPFDREGMADYLGCDRTALSRCLSKMKKQGLIDYYKNSFVIKKH